MGNKIFIKISLIIVSIIGVYSALVIFLITPEVSKYFASLEIKQVKTQLKRVETLIKSKEIYLKDFKKNKEIDYTINTKNITQIVYEIKLIC